MSLIVDAETASAFWDRVSKAGDDDCWEWSGTRDKNGYGRLFRHGHYYGAHRVSWLVHHGLIPDGMMICHSCDNPPCVNPGHLWLGTNRDNQLDSSRKGRAKGGSATHCRNGHKFTPENTIRINAYGRRCRACANEKYRKEYAKRRLERLGA